MILLAVNRRVSCSKVPHHYYKSHVYAKCLFKEEEWLIMLCYKYLTFGHLNHTEGNPVGCYLASSESVNS